MPTSLAEHAGAETRRQRRMEAIPIEWHRATMSGEKYDYHFGCMFRVLLDANHARGTMTPDEADRCWQHYLGGVSVHNRARLCAATAAQIERGYAGWERYIAPIRQRREETDDD